MVKLSLEKAMKLSEELPKISYAGDPNRPINSNQPEREIIRQYFALQNPEYSDHLRRLYDLNGGFTQGNALIFVVAFNEDSNLRNLFDQYACQSRNDFSVVLMANYTDDYAQPNIPNQTRFKRSIDIALNHSLFHQGRLHIVPKRFTKNQGGLSKARKYALDYSLFGAMLEGMEGIPFISNEGDTLGLSGSYVNSLIDEFDGEENPKFVQGEVIYPVDLLTKSFLLRAYTFTREAVHLNLGLHSTDFAEFGGIMPIGRNYAINAKAAVLAGGIDPTSRLEADDDMTFGWDLANKCGPSIKHFKPIPVLTNPRREAQLVSDLISGIEEDMFSAYVNFHGKNAIYNLSPDAVFELVAESRSTDERHVEDVLNQFYSWVLRESFKHAIIPRSERAQEIKRKFDLHQISYFAKESQLEKVILEEANELLNESCVEKAFGWFSHFVRGLNLPLSTSQNGLQSRIIIP